jgi:Methylase involved in ubiquinone/menaquinone biosynthesis
VYLQEGMTAIDLGCGPGMFTLAMARLVGETGRVIAVDLQPKMLELVREKALAHHLAARIRIHRNTMDSIGLTEHADFILSFYMVHEVKDQRAFLREVRGLLSPGGKYLVVEPMAVSRREFTETVRLAQEAGLEVLEYRNRWYSHRALFGPAP